MRFVFKTSYNDDIRLFKHTPQLLWYVLLLVIVAALPFLLDEFFIGVATDILIWSIAGMGLMMLTGHTGQASLGHAAFMAAGCYANTILMERGVPFIISFPMSGIIAGVIGVIVTFPVLRLHGVYLAIATLAISILTEDFIVIGETWTGGVTGLVAQPINIFGLEIDRYGTPAMFFYLALFIVLAVLAGYRNVLRTPTGRAFTAVRDSEISAQAMGINLTKTKAMAFGLSAGIAGLAGSLLGHYAGAFNHETFNLFLSIQLLLMIVIGGLGSIHGAFFGAATIVLLQNGIAIGRDWVNELTGFNAVSIPGIEFGLFGLIVLGFVIFEPQGLFGVWINLRTYFELFPFYRKNMFKRQKSFLKTERLR